ncbi:MAG: hypothetical protein ABIP75_07055 [Pyrinomonadaceae bacterium]
MAAPLMLLTIVGVLGAMPLIVIASLTKRRFLLKFVAVSAGLWLLAYFGLLLFSSLNSKEKILTVNEPKELCGFYLDCHLHVAVAGVSRSKTISGTGGIRSAAGTFYVVSVKVFNDAKRATIGLLDPRAIVVDQRGRQFVRSEAAEQALGDSSPPLNKMLGPDESLTKPVVFDLPDDVVQPMLQVNEGYQIDRWLELFLIGDENSLLHQKVKFRLDQ